MLEVGKDILKPMNRHCSDFWGDTPNTVIKTSDDLPRVDVNTFFYGWNLNENN